MAVIDLGQVGKTTQLDVKDLPDNKGMATFKMDRTTGRYVISSDRSVHLRSDAKATRADFRLPVGDYAKITLLKGQTLMFCLAEDEPDGLVWLTEITT